jgi:hypothetical protein
MMAIALAAIGANFLTNAMGFAFGALMLTGAVAALCGIVKAD